MKIYSISKTFVNATIKYSFCITNTLSKPTKNSPCIAAVVFLPINKCPVVKTEGASGSQVSPDSSACPAGLRPFLVYRKYILPHRSSIKSRF